MATAMEMAMSMAMAMATATATAMATAIATATATTMAMAMAMLMATATAKRTAMATVKQLNCLVCSGGRKTRSYVLKFYVGIVHYILRETKNLAHQNLLTDTMHKSANIVQY
jgi:hypothetical protein